MVITGDLNGSNVNDGAKLNVSNIYIDGKVDFNNGSAQLGSQTQPGKIHVTGDLLLTSGTRDIYGDTYVGGSAKIKDAHIRNKLYIAGNANFVGGTYYDDVYIGGNLTMKDAVIHGNVYVHGNVTIDWTPTISNNSQIYYKGNFIHPSTMGSQITSKFIKESNIPLVPGAEIYNIVMPSLRVNNWYTNKGYSNTIKKDNMKIYGNNITITDNSLGFYNDTYNNAIIISTGNININGGNLKMTGVLFAPNGQVTFSGASFEGLVIAKNGFRVTRGGTKVVFKSISNYITNPSEYPFE
jgi:hypothetical protein